MEKKIERKRQSGFTLVEIMIVLAIMTMIFGLVGVNLMGQFREARKKTAAIQIAQLKEALDAFYVANGFYPSSGQGLISLSKKPSSGSGRTPESYPEGGFLKKPVGKDPWGQEYIYESQDQNSYLLYSGGPDGKAETEDDNIKAE